MTLKNMNIDKLTTTFTITSIFISIKVLQEVGEPRSLRLAMLQGIILSLILNLGLILSCIKNLRMKNKKVFIFWLILSLVGVTLTIGGFVPYIEYISILFHLWLIWTIWREKCEAATYSLKMRPEMNVMFILIKTFVVCRKTLLTKLTLLLLA